MDFLKLLKDDDNITQTEKGAYGYNTTLDYCLDAFGSLAAMKEAPERKIIGVFQRAWLENKKIAIRLLFYIRDIRGGQGSRRVFRIIVKWLTRIEPKYIINNLDNFMFYGRADDLLCLLDTCVRQKTLEYIGKKLLEDQNLIKRGLPCSLLAKWLPSENASSKETRRYAKIIRDYLKYSPKDYRKVLSKMRRHIEIVESQMSANEWNNISYSELPAKASLKYSNAFFKHDEKRYMDFLQKNTKINAASVFPVDIIHKIYNGKNNKANRMLYETMWQSLPNYFKNKENSICVVDTSGSMTGTPIEVAISLGLYCADKSTGPFADHFITFSSKPKLQEIIGNDIYEKVLNLADADWELNTNLEAVFDLILETAIANNCKQEDLPQKLYIISDMQFDEATKDYENFILDFTVNNKRPFMKLMKEKYEKYGYNLPLIVYWNVNGGSPTVYQSTFEAEDCCMVSGYSPSLFKAIIEGTRYEVNSDKVLKPILNPIIIMLSALENERYNRIWAED